jgi:type I site-specific restriction endonuclease
MADKPEQKARLEIDANLTAAGWIVQDRDEVELTAGRGIAVREFAMKAGFGFADYLLYLDRKAVGAVEAKAQGTLTGVEAQSAKYAAGLPDNLPAHRRPLPFLFESNGSVTSAACAENTRRLLCRDDENRAAAAPPLDTQQRQLLRKIVDQLDAEAGETDDGGSAA